MNDSIQLPASELKLALVGLSKVLSPRPSLPVLGCCRLNRDEVGAVTLHATDLDSTVSYQFAALQPGTPVSLLLPAGALKDAKEHKGTLGFAPGPRGASMSFGNGVPLQLSTPTLEGWPVLPEVNQPGFPVDASLRTALCEALECASTDETRSAINSVYLDRSDPKAHYVVSTDGRSLFSANSFTFDLKESLRIPSSRFLKWNGWWNQGEAELAVQDFKEESWIKLRTGPWTFTTRGTEIPYPSWKQCVPCSEPLARIYIPETSIDTVLSALRSLPGNEALCYGVTLHSDGKTLVLSGCDKEGNLASVPVVEARVEGKPITIALNRQYFVRALKFGLTEIALTDALSPLFFCKGGKRLVVMPIRLEKPAPATTQKVEAPAEQTSVDPDEPIPGAAITQPNHSPQHQPAANQQSKNMNSEPKPQSAMQQISEQIDQIRNGLKNVLNDLNAAVTLLRQAEKERKLNDREVELVRNKLREIQSVSL